jgi:hypothetical protein
MDINDIKETQVWQLYEKGRNYHRRVNIYSDTDRNYRFYNGNQWEGAKLGGVEPVQKNFIKPIVKYKNAVIHSNLYAVNYSCENFENMAFYRESKRYCDMLNRYARRIWEKDKMDFKGRRITKDAAINDEGIIYVDFDKESMVPVNEIIDKNDIYYGNENDDDIQLQPYILIRKRMPVANAIEFAIARGLSEDKLMYIVGDNDNSEQSGDASKEELDNMVTIVYKMYKDNGTVRCTISTRYVDIVDGVDTGLKYYPVAHYLWEERKGSARGEGEVRNLIPNQIEVNRTEMRRVLTVKNQAYPIKVVDIDKVINPDAVDNVGSTIKTNGKPVDDVRKIVGTITPAQMSPDVKQLQEDLIQMTRDLAGAGDTATGQVNPESASGRAILAVQQASQAPMMEQKESYKNFIEDLAKIWLDYLIVHSADGVKMEEEVTDPMTGEEVVQLVTIPQIVLIQLRASVKIDITPKGVYDKYAQEQTIENLLTAGLFTVDRIGELKAYANVLDDDSVAPKMKILEVIKTIEEEQQKIAMLQAQTQMMQQSVDQFLKSDVDTQASQIVDAQRMQMGAVQNPGTEEGFEVAENVDDN